jgi:hypothetical protein
MKIINKKKKASTGYKLTLNAPSIYCSSICVLPKNRNAKLILVFVFSTISSSGPLCGCLVNTL